MRFEKGDVVGYLGDDLRIISKREILEATDRGYHFRELDGRKFTRFMFFEFPDWWIKVTADEERIYPAQRSRRRRDVEDRKAIRLKQPDMIITADLLRQYCKQVNGFAVYDEGWDDERVVREMAKRVPYIKLKHVDRLRRLIIGRFPPKVSGPSTAALLARVERLERWAAERPVQPFNKDGLI